MRDNSINTHREIEKDIFYIKYGFAYKSARIKLIF